MPRFFCYQKSNDVTYFQEEINKLLEIRYPILNVGVPLTVTAILNVTKLLLVTRKVASYVME